MARRTAKALFGTLVLMTACSGAGSDESSDVLQRASVLAQADVGSVQRLAPKASGWVEGRSGADANAGAGRVSHLPATADGAWTVQVAPLAIGVTMEGARSSPIEIDRGRAVYRDVYGATDAIVTSEPRRVELFYVERSDAAPREIALALGLPEGAKLRADDRGGVQIVAGEGVVRAYVPAAFALDADGKRFDVPMRVDGTQIALSVPRDGVRFPLLVDPILETADWVQAPLHAEGPQAYYHSTVYDPVRQRIMMGAWEWDGRWWNTVASNAPSLGETRVVWDSFRNRAVLFGGRAGLSYSNGTWEFDGTTWTQMSPTSSPPARHFHSMAFDSDRHVTVLFGGSDPSNNRLSDTWEYDGTTWTQRFPAFSPPGNAADGAAMEYDPATQRTTYVSSWNNATYEWNGTNWALHSTATNPAAGGLPALVYDSIRSRLVLFGGYYNGTPSNNTYEWDGVNWTLMNPTVSPTGRYGSAYAFDAATGTMIIQGGTNNSVAFSETWEYTGTTWRQRLANPPGRQAFALAFDVARGETILFGGAAGSASAVNARNDTWVFDGQYWAERFPRSSPPRLFGPCATYDSLRQRTILFGGTVLGVSAQTFEWDGSDWRVTSPAHKPPGRYDCALSYDAGRARATLVGGIQLGGGDTGTWEFDGTDWTMQSSAHLPPERSGAMLAYDVARNRTILFGGVVGGAYANDTWAWDGSDWQQLSPAVSPGARAYTQMAYDSARQLIVLTAGAGSGGPTSDTWEWNGTNWQLATPGHSPSGRGAAGFAYDSVRGRGVLFGGWNGSAALADTWLYSAQLLQGSDCTSAAGCATGFCVDGVCCNSACTGQCQACNVAGSVGTCATATGAPRGTRPACATDGSGCGGTCDGTNASACTYPTSAAGCPTCNAGTCVPAPTVTTNQASYTTSDAIIASYTQLAGTGADWISIALAGSTDTSFVRWTWTGGAVNGSVSFASGLPPGSYVARSFNNNGYVKVAESAAFTITGAAPITTVTTDKVSYAQSETALVSFAGMAGASTDWISIAPYPSSVTTFSLWSYTGGAASGSTAFSLASLPNGDYVARAYFNNGYVAQAESPVFHVGGAVAPATLSTDLSLYNTGDPIFVSYSGLQGSGADWISLARPGDPAGTYVAWQYTPGATSGLVTFAGIGPGTYVARAFNNNGYAIAVESAPFTVAGAPPAATISTDASSYASGASVLVTFAGLPGTFTDWLAIALPSDPATSYVRWVYTGGATSGTAPFAGLPPGTYVARSFPNNSYTVAAESAPFVVNP